MAENRRAGAWDTLVGSQTPREFLWLARDEDPQVSPEDIVDDYLLVMRGRGWEAMPEERDELVRRVREVDHD